MADRTNVLAVLVADICSSTRIYEIAGDARASQVVAGSVGAMAEIIAELGGHVIKTMGDGILCTFAGADEALRAAVALQAKRYGAEIQIRVGINYGPVVEKSRDIFGESVNVAARLVSVAKPSEVVLAGEAVARLSPRLRRQTQFFDRAVLAGLTTRTDLYRATGFDKDVTAFSTEIPEPELRHGSLALEYEGRRLVIVGEVGSFTIGREKGCDLIVEGRFVSRHHSTVRWRRGSFFLDDHSANGTYVQFSGQTPIFLKREELQLHSSGSISLGRPIESGSKGAIDFHCAV